MNPATRTQAFLAFTITIGQILSHEEQPDRLRFPGEKILEAALEAAAAIPMKIDKSREKQITKAYIRIQDMGWLDGEINAEATLSFLQMGLLDMQERTGNQAVKDAIEPVIVRLEWAVRTLNPAMDKYDDFELAERKYREFKEAA